MSFCICFGFTAERSEAVSLLFRPVGRIEEKILEVALFLIEFLFCLKCANGGDKVIPCLDQAVRVHQAKRIEGIHTKSVHEILENTRGVRYRATTNGGTNS